jgi:hypothetical protein
LWAADEYPAYFEKIFGADKERQRSYLKAILSEDRVTLSVGNRVLAAMLASGGVHDELRQCPGKGGGWPPVLDPRRCEAQELVHGRGPVLTANDARGRCPSMRRTGHECRLRRPSLGL